MIIPAELVRAYLLYFIIPLWLLAGLADYFLHKRTRIEDNAGTKESVLHMLQLAEAGIPVVLGLLLDINALVILVMLAALAIHEMTALWDVTYAHTRRYIGPIEQHMHSFMEVLPLMAVSFVIIMYWNQFLALLGLGPDVAQFEVRFKSDPIPTGYLIALFSSIVLFILLPYSEELWRCVRTAKTRRRQAEVIRQAGTTPQPIDAR